jgi:predicted transcriptional regulator YdeE
LIHLNKGDYLKPVLEEKPTFRVIGLMSRVTEDRQAIAKLWEALASETRRLMLPRRRLNFYGFLWYPQGEAIHDCFYMAAIETNSSDIGHSALVSKTFPPLHLARFIHKGPDGDIDLTRDYIYHTWLPKSGRRLGSPLEIEYYGGKPANFDDEEIERTLYIPLEQA